MQIPLVDLQRQYQNIKMEIDACMSDVIATSSFIGGPFVRSFEEEFAAYCGAKFCIGVGNGTDALFIALKTLGIGPGDEVITAANSFVATAEAISMTGARVVFVDIHPQTYNIDVEKIEASISTRTRAILPVHLYGQPADMGPIREIAAKHGLYIVCDAAQAHGASYRDTSIAQLADITCFSFYPGKNLGAYGDGGALVTNRELWAEYICKYANHGRSKKYDHEFEGINSRLDGLQAAILSTKLRHLNDWSEKRRRNANLYNEMLQGIDIITPAEPDFLRSVYHLYVVRLTNGKRDSFREFLNRHGISTGIHYPVALPFLKAYQHLGYTHEDFPKAQSASQQIVSLPMFPELSAVQIHYVAETIRKFLQ